MSDHRDPFTFRETDSEIATLRTRVEEQAEAKLARVVWVLNKHASDAVRNLCPDIANAICQTVDAALAAARDQPMQEKLPLGHPYTECRRFHGRINEHDCAAYNHCDECGEPESAHQPTQEKPEDRR